MKESELKKHTYKELQRIGKEHGISKVYGINKATLISNIMSADIITIEVPEPEPEPVPEIDEPEIFNMKEMSDRRISELVDIAGEAKRFFTPAIVEYLQRKKYYNIDDPRFAVIATAACQREETRMNLARKQRV